jgi:site-specific DNA-cytosine methylase
MSLRVAVLFDGAGLARFGLEQAGHYCTGFEIDKHKHYLSQYIGSGNCILADVRDVDLTSFDAVWASPPCQYRSRARNPQDHTTKWHDDLVQWCLGLPHSVLWVENVISQREDNNWGQLFNAVQFSTQPLQNRLRIIGGRYKYPKTYRSFVRRHPKACPSILATEYKGGSRRGAFRYFGGRVPTIEECAYLQGLKIPLEWRATPFDWDKSPAKWIEFLYDAIGNGVPTYMSYCFGVVYDTVC